MNKEASSHVQFYTKIQEATPSHLSTLPNKEVGYFVHVQLQKLYKLKNCIDSARSNSELYKKFSKKFTTNLKNHVNQMIVCCGLEESARMQTSIGMKKNPGIFMILGISVLDEKYQNDHRNYDVEISFVESREGKFYDLLSYTKQPLKATKKSDGYFMNQSYFKITTFAQFLKLFKIAVFNNKERDLKTDQTPKSNIRSSFIMSIMTKTYLNGKVKQQKSTFIDFSMEEPEFGQKSQWEYFMIELNNQTSRKKLHYHLVEPNPLISLINSYLKNGQTYVLNSFTSNSQQFQKNYTFMQEFENLVAEIIPKRQDSSLDSQSEEILQGQIHQIAEKMLDNLGVKKYNSLREYRQIKQHSIDTLQQSRLWNKKTVRILSKLCLNKRKIKVTEHALISDQLRLIGSCVKTDHYKDFYQAKSYLSLQRQVSIKTQQTIRNLLSLIKQREVLREEYSENKSKQLQSLESFLILKNDQSKENTLALTILKQNKKIQERVSLQKNLLKKTIQYHQRLYNQINYFNMRTVSDEILREGFYFGFVEEINGKLEWIKSEMGSLAKNGKINFELEEGSKDAHLNLLIREIRTLVKNDRRKRKNIDFPKNTAVLQKMPVFNSQLSTKFTKLPLIQNTTHCLTGHLSLKDLLIDPNQSI